MNKIQVTKLISDLRELASNVADKDSEEFKEIMVKINSLKVKLQYQLGDENASK